MVDDMDHEDQTPSSVNATVLSPYLRGEKTLTFYIHSIDEKRNEVRISLFSEETRETIGGRLFSDPVASLCFNVSPEEADVVREAFREGTAKVTLRLGVAP